MAQRITLLILIALLLVGCGPAASSPTSPAPAAPDQDQLPIQEAPPSNTPTTAPPAQPGPTREPVPTEDYGYEDTGADPTPNIPATGSTPAVDNVRVFQLVPGETNASYEVGETFLNQNNRFNLAVGSTTQVSGEVYLNFADPSQSTLGTITVDLSTLQSDSSRRDGAIRREWLESSRFPLATFTPSQVVGLPAAYNQGDQIQFDVSGDLTIREVTRPVTFNVTAALSGDRLSGTATTDLLMTDFGFNPPDIIGVLSAENEVKVILNFVAEPK